MINLNKPVGLIIALAIFTTLIFPLTSIGYNSNDYQSTITKDEQEALKTELANYEYDSEDMETDVLYSASGEAAFVIGVSNLGYVILDRNNYEICECGQVNPFSEVMDQKKYYGGPFQYYVIAHQRSDLEDKMEQKLFYNIRTKKTSDIISTMVNTHNADSTIAKDDERSYNSVIIHRLQNNVNYIRKKAFGSNITGDLYEKTCSAIASQIALNYISEQYKVAFVKPEHISETITEGLQVSANFVASHYKRANRMHHYLVDNSGMGPVTTGLGIKYPLNRYVKETSNDILGYNYSYNFNLLIDYNSTFDSIETSINNDLPVIITTTIALGSSYSYHSMCVYGYRIDNGTTTYLVHDGWLYNDSNTNYTQPEVWIPSSYVSFVHFFSFQSPLAVFQDVHKYYSPDSSSPSGMKKYWGYPGILYVVKEGLMSGTTATSFSPESNMNRAMMVTVLYRMAGEPNVNYHGNFWDVPNNAWYTNAVAWASNNGIVSGTGTATINGVTKSYFSPNAFVTREQVAVFLYRYTLYRGRPITGLASLNSFLDSGSVSTYAENAMKWAYGNGLINGVSNTLLNPQGTATRETIATIITRYILTFGR